MKNIVTITLTVLTLLLVGFIITTYLQGQKTSFVAFLPQTFTTSRELTLFQQDILPEPRTVTLGLEEEFNFNVNSTQGQYIDDKQKLALSVWIEEVSEDDYELYKQKAWERYQSPAREGISEQHTIRDRTVYLSFRDIKEDTDTRTMVTMGGGYVFFPEKNVIVTYSFFNPRLYACTEVQKPDTCLYDAERSLPTMEDSKNVAEQLIISIDEHDSQ
ncbi:MAG: hypothetical protein UV60_C0007G0008 [Parcubacteria group bacterium GW2011_GWA2_43_11]|nr:MAG: hypothetical protein UU89_C0025G0003 [Parcubacteria group bacterium GW2011_GWC2_42_11]KKS85521.1 MAG: hypothetical protein UV60_C0007G0008 [Parcubacteria group bacterium GW2011_GWA2_43_11]